MAYVRDETLGNFTDEELIEIVKRNLDKLGIAYEEGPGDWSGFLGLDPADFDTEEGKESYMLLTRPSGRSQYRAKASVNYAAIGKGEDGGISMAVAQGFTRDGKFEDDPVLTAA